MNTNTKNYTNDMKLLSAGIITAKETKQKQLIELSDNLIIITPPDSYGIITFNSLYNDEAKKRLYSLLDRFNFKWEVEHDYNTGFLTVELIAEEYNTVKKASQGITYDNYIRVVEDYQKYAEHIEEVLRYEYNKSIQEQILAAYQNPAKQLPQLNLNLPSGKIQICQYEDKPAIAYAWNIQKDRTETHNGKTFIMESHTEKRISIFSVFTREYNYLNINTAHLYQFNKGRQGTNKNHGSHALIKNPFTNGRTFAKEELVLDTEGDIRNLQDKKAS